MGVTSSMVQVDDKLWVNPAEVWGVEAETVRGITLIFVGDRRPPFRSDWTITRVIAALGIKQ